MEENHRMPSGRTDLLRDVGIKTIDRMSGEVAWSDLVGVIVRYCTARDLEMRWYQGKSNPDQFKGQNSLYKIPVNLMSSRISLKTSWPVRATVS